MLGPLQPYRHVRLVADDDARVAELIVSGPLPGSLDLDAGADWWPLRMARELDDALLRLRFNHATIGMIVLRGRDRNIPIPFGPYLAGAGVLAVFFGPALVSAYLG